MMRRYHRWLAVLFAALLVWISVTGLLSHAFDLYRDAQPAPVAATPPGFVCPETMSCRPKFAPGSASEWVGYFHHIHAGAEYGPIGRTLGILSGFALLFFALSGLTMYIQMFRERTAKPPTGKSKAKGGKWFWR
jgi:hypothetical protein